MSHPSPLAASGKSLLERAFLTLCKMEGLPEPESEVRFAPPRRWRFDFAWPEQKVAVECEGGTWIGGRHQTGTGFAKDAEKYNEAALLGWIVLRFTSDQIENGAAMDAVRRALDSRRTPEAPWWSKP